MVETAGTAKIRNTGFRTDTCTAEKDDVAAAIHELFQFLNCILHINHLINSDDTKESDYEYTDFRNIQVF